MLRFALALSLVACGSDLRYHSQAFTAPTACAQGPFDVDVPADGTTAVDGLEVIACTSHRLAGHVEFWMGATAEMKTYGDVADNQRCVGGSDATVVAESSTSSSISLSSSTGSGSGVADKPVFVKQALRGGEDGDDACAAYGGTAQWIGEYSTHRTNGDNLTDRGSIMSVRLWSSVPNDLDGVVFLVRQITSKDAPEQLSKAELARQAKAAADEDKRIHTLVEHDRQEPHVAPTPTEEAWHAPPDPLVEDRPARTTDAATWVPGYWKWTGLAYGWVAGFWRDAADMPAPRVETPGAAPQSSAIWIGGVWRRSGGGWTWIGGRWRTR